ncbi:MAG: PQQ-binding-like beta-propeller repeat protein [Pirellulales bacterium]
MPRLSLRRGLVFSVLCAAVWSPSPARAQWASWRGPNANGSIADGGYPTAWTADKVAWKVKLPGKGSSTPIVLDGRIYLTTPVDGRDAVMALDLDGKKLWLTPLGAVSEAKHRLGSSCNASPATDGQGIFVYFRSGRLAALDLDGKVRWINDLAKTYGPEELFWDQGSSPVVTDQHVILSRLHGGESWIAGFDKQTGEMRWQQKRNFKVPAENDNGYTTPLFFKHKGQDAFLVWCSDHLTAHSAADGALLWTAGGFNPKGSGYWPAISSPVIYKNLAIIPVGRDDRDGQGAIHAVRIDGEGDRTDAHRAWQRDDLGVFVTSLAEYNGRIYLLRPRGNVVCLDPSTGDTIWSEQLPKGRASYYASPVIAGGLLYAAREDGLVFVASIDDGFKLVGENPLGEQIVSSPALADGRLLIRGEEHLFCIKAEER